MRIRKKTDSNGNTYAHLGNWIFGSEKEVTFEIQEFTREVSAIGQHACVALQLYTARYPWGPGNYYLFDQE